MKPKYFPGLDGLRVLAILLVVLTHFPKDWVPQFAGREALLYFVGGSGKIGVSILFVMTGFLMSWLHPQPASNIDFYRRRLARIFPLFLVMVASLTLIRANPSLPILTQLGIVLGFALLARLFKRPIGRKITWSWLGLMLAAALAYIFWLNRIPPAIYYQVWPNSWRIVTAAAANATMTLPFGQYIAQLDGVYWALILEVWFYLLYPVLFVPLSRKFKPVMYPAALLFCFGLSIIADRILGLKMLEPAFLIYFIIGVSLGRNLSWWQKRIKPAPILLFLILLSAGQYFLTLWLPEFYYPWMRLLLAPLAGLAVLAATFKHRFLEQPWLTRLSRYTYAVFLTHSLVIDQIYQLIKPGNLGTGLLMVVLSFASMLLLSIVLYHLAEQPYFITKKLANRTVVPRPLVPFLGLTLTLIFLLDRAFRPPLAFFSSFSRHGKVGQAIVLGSEPAKFTFAGAESNLGMITTHLKTQQTPGAKSGGQNDSQLIIKLDDASGTVAATIYKGADIYEDRYHPFGLPLEQGSQGKQYTLTYQLLQPDSKRQVKLINDEEKFISVYFNRKISVRFIINKLAAPFTSPLYWLTLLNLVPLLIMLHLSYFKEVRKNVGL